MQAGIDLLYLEAARFFEKNPKKPSDSLNFPDYNNYSSELSLRQFCIYACVYTLRDPTILRKGAERIHR